MKANKMKLYLFGQMNKRSLVQSVQRSDYYWSLLFLY